MSNTELDTIYKFIVRYMEEHDGLSPSLREIADGCHYHHSTVDRYLLMLEMQGRVKRDAHRARSIRLVKSSD
ncbi:MAG: helix-turn-helix domain-containing protein [Anaerolineae bacterium]|nr:helix-turn-helix domain-containing protein [Anaerolineae bacterium]NUQ06117.1 helix-turn-helix domain-containing protein [Anaerolineae bacterium]